MKIVIVGGGAIGRLFSAFLNKGEHEVILIDIDQHVVCVLQEQGIGLVEKGSGDPDIITSVPVKALSDGSQVTTSDLVIILVKSTATLAAIKSVTHLITDQSPVLCMQTGLGNLEVIEEVVPRKNILLGLTYMSGTSLGESKVRPGMVGKTYIGELNGDFTPRLERICKTFIECGVKTQMVDRIMGRLWSKVIVYSAINPVSTIARVPNGMLISKMESITLMKRLIDEGMRVAEACAVDLVHSDLYEVLFDVCRKSYNNLSSMLQDVLNGRSTEIGAQNGVICRFAEEKGVAVPTHHTVVQLIKLLEYWQPDMNSF